MNERKLLCFAFGDTSGYEAICVDFDLSVQGGTFREVYDTLNAAIRTYIEDAMKEDAATTRRLLSRRAPWRVRAGLKTRFITHMLVRRWFKGRREEASFDLACPA